MPSLTLNNPDMILPFGSERESQTPSPPTQLVYLSNLNARYNSSNTTLQAPPNATGGRQKKNFSRHAWSHEDLNTSRRLSDIGEELSPVRVGGFEDGPNSAPVAASGSGSGAGAGSRSGSKAGFAKQTIVNPPVRRDSLPRKGHTRNVPSTSSSIISTGSSRAPSSTEVSPPLNTQGSSPPTDRTETPSNDETLTTSLPDSSAIVSAAKEKGPGDEFSSAILSSEAERILENAKKRLTLMEGNLNRARSSVRLTPSPSPSSPGYIQPLAPHQPGGLYRSISHRKSSGLRRQSLLQSQDASTNRHSRVQSETNFPPETNLSTDTKRISRSVSAMGSSSATKFNDDERTFQYEPTRAYLTHRASISSLRSPSLRDTQSPDQAQSPLPEKSAENSPTDSPHGLGIHEDEETKSNDGSFSPIYSSYGPPSRAQSQLQVRDLQYQMKGLHIKISSLKVRTQEDNLRRRSLQSLRTPSPLTASEPWYPNALELRDGRSSRGSVVRREGSGEYSRDMQSPIVGGQTENHRGRQDIEQACDSPLEKPIHTRGSPEWPQHAEYHDGRQSVAESAYEDAEEGDFEDGDIDREALDEILREPLDDDLEDFPPEGLPHEEREDAFDYEHFILHSALGNYTRQLRSASDASHGSTETTRPTQSIQHSRADSVMSDSTVATFATATEGEGEHLTDDEDDLLYWDRRFNHELRHRHVPSQSTNSIAESDRAETPRGPREDNNATPTGEPPQSPQSIKTSGRSSSATTGSATPTSLVSSLVSTVRAASSPHAGSVTPTSGGINDDDTQMLEKLFQSLGNVCTDLQALTTSPDPDVKTAKVLRRRLDAARRVLDGELD